MRLDLIGDGTEEAVCLVEEGVDRLRVQGLVGAPGRQCVGVGGMEERKLAEDGDDGLEGRAGEDGRDAINADGRTRVRCRWAGSSRDRARLLHHGSPSKKEEGGTGSLPNLGQ